jgi:hypothetical protein
MARSKKRIHSYSVFTNILSINDISKSCNIKLVTEALNLFGKNSIRNRKIPASIVVYFVIMLSLWRELPQDEVLRTLFAHYQMIDPDFIWTTCPNKGSITKARIRLGSEVLEYVADKVLDIISPFNAPGSFYQGMRLMSLDGTSITLPDSPANAEYFGYPGSSRGETAFPKCRVVALIENGPRIVTSAMIGKFKDGERVLASKLIGLNKVTPEMLLMSDRGIYSFDFFNQVANTGANILWRVKSNHTLPVVKRLDDKSFISKIFSANDRKKTNPSYIRVIEYEINDQTNLKKELVRLITTLKDHKRYPAKDFPDLYHDRWEIESCFGEIKDTLPSKHALIRSHLPDLVKQEIYGLLIVHHIVGSAMAVSAWAHNKDPDILSFSGARFAIKRYLPQLFAAPPPSNEKDAFNENA